MINSIEIKTAGELTEESSYILQQLGNDIETELQIRPNLNQLKTKGEKAIGLTETIEIVGLSLTAITTFLSILQYWKSKNSVYSIKYNIGEIEIEISNLSEREYEKKILEINEKYQAEPHVVILEKSKSD